MTGHLSAQRIELYNQGKLTPAELLLVGDHLAVCAACRQQMSITDSLRRAFGAFGAELQSAADKEQAHLPAEQMAAYVENVLDEVDRSIAEIHIEGCAECHAELQDLRRLKGAMIDSVASEQTAMWAPTLWSRMIALWRPRAHWLPFSATVLILFMFFWLVIIPLRKQVTQLNARWSELQQRNDELGERISSSAGAQEGTDRIEETPVEGPSSVEPVSVSLNDGESVVVLDKEGRLTGLRSLSPAHEQLVKAVLTAQRVKTSPLVSDLTGKRDVLMGPSAGREGFALIGPVATSIENDSPTFRWSPLTGASGYVVTVYNKETKTVTVSERISGTEWTPPKPLQRGILYAWEVTATRDGQEVTVPIPPIPQARFLLLDQAKRDELNRARRIYPRSNLVLGILYAQAGLQDEARRQFEALVAANPDSLTAQRLLRSVKPHRVQ